MTSEPKTIYLKDYAPTPYGISHVDMTVELDPERTRVTSRLSVSPRSNRPSPMVLDGEGLTLHAITIDGKPLAKSAYSYENDKLTIHNPPNADFALEIVQGCNPSANTALSGLYVSNGIFCTQMEAEGFRRFAFFYDRPDVMATYRVRLEADRDRFPVLLANGNPGDHGRLPGGRHYASGSIRGRSRVICSPSSPGNWNSSKIISAPWKAATCACASMPSRRPSVAARMRWTASSVR